MTDAGHGWRRIRWVMGPLAATALTAVLATRGYVSIDATRVRLVTAARAAESGAVHAGTAGRPEVNQLHPPFALIARIDNRSGNASNFAIDVDGARVCEATVAAGVSRRIDCDVTRGWDRTIGDHAVVVQSAQTDWALDYLELAVHHGGSGGFNRFVVLPAGATRFDRPGPVALLVAWLLIAAGFLLPFPPRLPRAVRIGYGVVVTIIGAAILAIVVAPWVSNYQVILSAATFARWSCLLMAPQVVLGARTLAVGAIERGLVTVRVKIALVGLLVFAAFALVMHSRLQSYYRGNYSGFLQIATHLFNAHPTLSTRDEVRASLVFQTIGYDGQFMYFAAYDPFLREFADRPATYRAFIDAPPYRFGRIGFSLLTRLLSFSQWPRYPGTMVWLVIAALGVSAIALAAMAVRTGASPAWGLLVLLVPGFWQSLSTALPEPVAAAFVIGGCWCAMRGRWLAGAALWGAALLVRETSVIIVLCVLAERFLSGHRRQALVAAGVALLPVAAWRLYVGWVLFEDWGWHGFSDHPPDFGWPLGGFLDVWSKILAGAYEPGMTVPGIALPVVLVGALAVAGIIAVRRPSGLAMAAVAYALVAVSLNFEHVWAHVSDGQRLTYEVFVLLALTSPAAAAASRGSRLVIYGFWAASAWYVFFGSFDAAFVREALTGG